MSDGAIYTVSFFRGHDEDDPEPHGDRTPVDQFSAEMQEAMDETGEPAGFFKVTERREATWAEWDAISHIGTEPPGGKPITDPYAAIPVVKEFGKMTRTEATVHLRDFHQVWFTSDESLGAMIVHHREQHQGDEMPRGHVPHQHDHT